MTFAEYFRRVTAIVDEATSFTFDWESINEHDVEVAWMTRVPAEKYAAELLKGMEETDDTEGN
jgi:hypothetical protein